MNGWKGLRARINGRQGQDSEPQATLLLRQHSRSINLPNRASINIAALLAETGYQTAWGSRPPRGCGSSGYGATCDDFVPNTRVPNQMGLAMTLGQMRVWALNINKKNQPIGLKFHKYMVVAWANLGRARVN